MKKSRALQILKKLKEEYPNIRFFLKHKSVFQLLVATILSAQCTDKRVNQITPALFAKYSTPKKMSKASLEEIKKLVKSCNYFNQKAKYIKKSSKKIISDFDGKVPDSMEKLVKLPGVGRKTANVVLSQGFDKNVGIAVDTHVARLSKVLGLSDNSNPEKIEKDLMNLFPKKDWNFVSVALIKYGREVCPAKKHDTSRCWLGHFE